MIKKMEQGPYFVYEFQIIHFFCFSEESELCHSDRIEAQ